MGLKTTTAGWFPKPVELRRARRRFDEGDLGAAELRALEAQATASALCLQEALGLDLLVDGQMDRGDAVGSLAERIEGLEPAGLVRLFDNRYYRRPRITGDIAWSGPLTVEAWRAAQDKTTRPVKAVVTGPYTLMSFSFDEHYHSRERAARALASAVRAELEALLEAGAREFQLDEQAISSRPDEMTLAAEVLAHATEPLRGRARVVAHLCYGDLAPVLDAVVALPVDGLLLSLSDADERLLERLAGLPGDKLLGAGVIDAQSPEVERPEVIRGRAERLLGGVPAERLWLAPDAGLRGLAPEIAQSKLEALVRAAADLG